MWPRAEPHMGQAGNCSRLGDEWRNGAAGNRRLPYGESIGTSTASRHNEGENKSGRTQESVGHD